MNNIDLNEMSWVKKVLIGDRRSTSRSSLLNVLWEGWIFLLPYTNNKVHVYHIKLLRIVSGFFNTKTIFCIVYICIYLQHVSFVHVLTIILHVRSCLKSYLFYTHILWLSCVLEIIKMANIIDFISTDQIICRILILEI